MSVVDSDAFEFNELLTLDVGRAGASPIGTASAVNAAIPRIETNESPARLGILKSIRRSMRCRNALRDSRMPTKPRLASGRWNASFATSSRVGA